MSQVEKLQKRLPKVDLGPYDFIIYVAHGERVKLARRTLQTLFTEQDDFKLEDEPLGLTVWSPDVSKSIFILLSDFSLSTIAHEATHAASFALQLRYCFKPENLFENEEQEQLANLVGFITEKVHAIVTR